MILKHSFFYFFLLLIGCSGLEQAEQEKIRRQNARAEMIYRRHDEMHYAILPLEPRVREYYPWEEGNSGGFPPITKEWFRCRGRGSNPARIDGVEGKAAIYRPDCGGSERHSLPVRENEEFIYPILLEIINHLQSKTQRQVVVTCGYRCPTHNAYADPSRQAEVSKHMIGGEVDFYIQGWELKPEEIVKWIMQYYRKDERYRGKKEYEEFLRYEKADTDVSTLPWYNKELFIKIYQKNEGRDLDNRHPYPYISLQVRFDRDLNKRVTYSPQEANTCYRRY